MDCFYAAVEQRDSPQWKGKPLVVGGRPGGRGVVATASYEARRYGIHSAMPISQAYQRCPHAIFVKPRIQRYREVSHRIFEIFRQFTDRIEPLSLDEAYLDVTENLVGEVSATKIARQIKERVRDETQLTCSAGVAPLKFVAKIASDLDKPDGLTVVPPSQVDSFVRKLPVEKLWGVGPVTAKKLHSLGFHRVADLRKVSESELRFLFGKHGGFLHDLAWARDRRPVRTERVRKSRGAERTFAQNLLNVSELCEVLDNLAQRLTEKKEDPGRRLTLKVRYSDFTTLTRCCTSDHPLESSDAVAEVAKDLLLQLPDLGRRPIRLLGLSLSKFSTLEKWEQLKLRLDNL